MAKGSVNSTDGFVNPFEEGSSYEKFIKALDGKSVKEYLTGKKKNDTEEFTQADIDWLTSEIEAYGYNELHKQENLERAQKENFALQTANNKTIN